MRGVQRSLSYLNPLLERVNLRVEQVRPTNWDRTFKLWTAQATRQGLDPNDIGDKEWAADRLYEGLERFYLPLLGPSKTILELGPGSGRLSRHLVGNCKKLILADFSPAVLAWMSTYLAGRGPVELHRVSEGRIPAVADESVDVVVAHGVMDHMDQETLLISLREFRRVLAIGGHAAFGFNDLSGDEAREAFTDQIKAPFRKAGRFRFHHPESIRSLAGASGLEVMQLEPARGGSLIGFALLLKP
jgi:SAM-dependent methyltransferase